MEDIKIARETQYSRIDLPANTLTRIKANADRLSIILTPGVSVASVAFIACYLTAEDAANQRPFALTYLDLVAAGRAFGDLTLVIDYQRYGRLVMDGFYVSPNAVAAVGVEVYTMPDLAEALRRKKL